MDNILNEIVNYKRNYIKRNKKYFENIIRNIKITPINYSLIKVLKQKEFCIIGEIKKKSPSAKIIRNNFKIEEIVEIYKNSKEISAVSILTDEKYFAGSIKYFEIARKNIKKPLLRKDFIIDEKQIYESKFIGADVILLIASILDKNQLFDFYNLSKTLNIDVIVEVHNKREIDKVLSIIKPKIIGINNRNLKTFKVNLNTTFKLNEYIKKQGNGIYIISESGINNNEQIKRLKENKINGALIGTSIMKAKSISEYLKDLVK